MIPCQPVKCQNSRQSEIHLSINPSHLPQFAKLSELVESVRIIPLETSKFNLIGITEKVFVGQKDILIATGGSKIDLFRFSSDGKFLNKIGNQGKGPGEYIYIRTLQVMKDSYNVYIGGPGMRKILEYSFDGKFIREIPFANDLRNATLLDQNHIAFNSSMDYEVRVANMLTRDTLKYLKIAPGTRTNLWGFSGDPSMGFFYTARGRDTIWKIGPESMYPIIICNFGSGHFSLQDEANAPAGSGGYPPGKLLIGGGVIYGSGYYAFPLGREDTKKKFSYCCMLVKAGTGATWHLKVGPESDDILFCTSTYFQTFSASGEWVSVVDAYELIEALPKIKENTKFKYRQGLIQQIEKLNIEDNPVLVFYKLK